MAACIETATNESLLDNLPVECIVIQTIRTDLIQRLDPVALMDCFEPYVFTEEERQNVICECNNKGKIGGSRLMLDILLRKKDGWFGKLIRAMAHQSIAQQYTDVIDTLKEERERLQKEEDSQLINDAEVNLGVLEANFEEKTEFKLEGGSPASIQSEPKEGVLQTSFYRKEFSENNNVLTNNLQKEKNCNKELFAAAKTASALQGKQQTCLKELNTNGGEKNNETVPKSLTAGEEQLTEPKELDSDGPRDRRDEGRNVLTSEEETIVKTTEQQTPEASFDRASKWLKDNRLKPESFKPRDYQLELAEVPLTGENCILCAPTNSGKTFVAIMVTKEHLSKNDSMGATNEQAPKVIVVVPTVPLTQQVSKVFRSHLPLYKVEKRSGGTNSKLSLKGLANSCDVLVLTADILKNALCDDVVKFKDFTLMILDECHHTTKDHPYNDIMNLYIKEKTSSNDQLPQILGLTASPGAGKKPDHDEAKKTILRLCANMDADHFIKVKDETKVQKYIERPSRVLLKAPLRTMNPFKETVCEWMVILEKEVNLGSTSPAKSTPMYQSSIVESKKSFLSKSELSNVKICEHLFELNKALMFSDDVRMKDGLALIEKLYTPLCEKIDAQVSSVETFLAGLYNRFKGRLMESVTKEADFPNPKMDKLRTCIIWHNNNHVTDIRVMVFTKTKELALALLDWMNLDDGLKGFNASHFTGSQADTFKGGMTKQLQKSVLAAFDNGHHKILISTSIGEEGIDIPGCSLAVRYDHVTNEKSMIQSRGRVRMGGGKEAIIGGEITFEKDQLNLNLEKAMRVAIEYVSQISKEQLRSIIDQIQADATKEREEKNKRKVELENSCQSNNVILLCKGCEVFICSGSDIRLYEKTKRVLFTDKARGNVEIVEHPDPKLEKKYGFKMSRCKECKASLGITTGDWRQLPCIAIMNFYCKISGETKHFKQWKKVPFKVEEFSETENPV